MNGSHTSTEGTLPDRLQCLTTFFYLFTIFRCCDLFEPVQGARLTSNLRLILKFNEQRELLEEEYLTLYPSTHDPWLTVGLQDTC